MEETMNNVVEETVETTEEVTGDVVEKTIPDIELPEVTETSSDISVGAIVGGAAIGLIVVGGIIKGAKWLIKKARRKYFTPEPKDDDIVDMEETADVEDDAEKEE